MAARHGRLGVKDVTLKEGDSEWGDGKHAYAWADMAFPDNKSKDVLIRFGKGNLYHCQVFATYESKNSSPLVVTYGWQEGEKTHKDTHSVAIGKASDTWTIPTGQNIKAQWVRFSAQ